jgi:hypothetical protein
VCSGNLKNHNLGMKCIREHYVSEHSRICGIETLNVYLHERTRTDSLTELLSNNVPVDRRLALKHNEDQKMLLSSIIPDDTGRGLACWHFADCGKNLLNWVEVCAWGMRISVWTASCRELVVKRMEKSVERCARQKVKRLKVRKKWPV